MKNYILVTGATGGIGSALVREAVSLTAFDGVFGVCRSREKWNSLFERQAGEKPPVGQAGAGALPLPYEAAALGARLEEYFKPQGCAPASSSEAAQMSVVMTAFTIEPLAHVRRLTPEEVTDNFRMNAAEPIAQLQTILAVCEACGIACRVIYLGSGASRHAMKGWGLYGASKSYMGLLLRTLSLEEGLPVVCVDPGVVDTGMQETIRRTPREIFDRVEQFSAYHEQGRLRSPQSVARLLLHNYVLQWRAEAFEEKLDEN